MKTVKMHLYEFIVEDDSISIEKEIRDCLKNLADVADRIFDTKRDTLSGLHATAKRDWVFLHIGKHKKGALESCIDLNKLHSQTLDPQQVPAPNGTEFLKRESFCLLWKNNAIIVVSELAGIGDVYEFLKELLKRNSKDISMSLHKVISHELKAAIEDGKVKGVTISGLTTETNMKKLFEKGNTFDEMYVTGKPKGEPLGLPLAMTFKYSRGKSEDFLNFVKTFVLRESKNSDKAELNMGELEVVINTEKSGRIKEDGFAMVKNIGMTEYGSFVTKESARDEMCEWMKEILEGED
jgi:hypothetical protein